MKRFIITILISFTLVTFSKANDSMKIVNLQREVSNLRASVTQLKQENNKIQDEIQGFQIEHKASADSLCEQQKVQADGLNTLADKVGADLTETNKKIDVSANVGACGIFIALIMLVVV